MSCAIWKWVRPSYKEFFKPKNSQMYLKRASREIYINHPINAEKTVIRCLRPYFEISPLQSHFMGSGNA